MVLVYAESVLGFLSSHLVSSNPSINFAIHSPDGLLLPSLEALTGRIGTLLFEKNHISVMCRIAPGVGVLRTTHRNCVDPPGSLYLPAIHS